MLLKGQTKPDTMIPERERGGGRTKGALALRAVEGLKKLKEDRRIAAQAVAKVRAACVYVMWERAGGTRNSVCFRFESRI